MKNSVCCQESCSPYFVICFVIRFHRCKLTYQIPSPTFDPLETLSGLLVRESHLCWQRGRFPILPLGFSPTVCAPFRKLVWAVE